MYLTIATQPDITFVVSCLFSFLNHYIPKHWLAAVRILHYLKGSCSLALTLGCDHTPSLVSYSNSNYANCPDTSHSISGYCHLLEAGIIS